MAGREEDAGWERPKPRLTSLAQELAVERIMEFHQVRYFLALSKSLNFTRAAETCNVTQPALTKGIQKLEYELGGELVFRERRLTQLTELGALVLPTLEKMLAAADAARADARDFRKKEIAPIKIGLTPCVSANLIAALLSRLTTTVPGLQVDLIEAAAHDMPRLLLQGDLGAAFSGGDQHLVERIDGWRLFDEAFQVLVSIQSPLASMEAIPLDILKDQIWLERDGCEAISALWQACLPHAEPPRILHRGHQESHLHQMVAAGLGILLAGEHVEGPAGAVGRPIKDDPLRHSVRLLAVAGRRYSPALGALVKVARNYDWGGRRREVRTVAVPQAASHLLRGQEPERLATVA